MRLHLAALLLVSAGCAGERAFEMQGSMSRETRTWYDTRGNIRAHRSASGLFLFFERDQRGRVLAIEARRAPYCLEASQVHREGEPLWRHGFLYDESGRLLKELDCEDSVHEFGPDSGRQVSPFKGTALSGHVHAREAH